MHEKVRPSGKFIVRCYSNDRSKMKWEEITHNLVVYEACERLLDSTLLGGTQVGTWSTFLTSGTPTVASADTMASHAGWDEFLVYDETTRPVWIGVRSGQVASNSASLASFTISSANQTIGGAGLTELNSKDAATGALYCVAAFTGGDRTGNAIGDKIDVIYNATTEDDAT